MHLGKGRKERAVPFSAKAAQALLEYGKRGEILARWGVDSLVLLPFTTDLA